MENRSINKVDLKYVVISIALNCGSRFMSIIMQRFYSMLNTPISSTKYTSRPVRDAIGTE